ncbi:ArnT family glycosyltransferase [Algoriphagus sediminis]|uniref:Glycosyltransferase family 39 protein n=1 Tax=Algoriphagus sediminis TaxID=3057113 RepID=A0ABT7YG71_9BACT|nr:glycosyltransferase family 39 protein [Algoriphagus sediminis]MDN3205199.1 glycosyltransferase family 39 protein [Algoriphagus sediminis]
MQKTPNYKLYFWIVTLALAAAKVIFTFRPEIDLFTEEAQYWLWSENLAWHYYSKPPMVAYLNWIGTSIFGTTEIGVRFFAIAFGLGSAWVTFTFGSYLYSDKVGFWSALILQAMPFWWLISTFHTTDTSVAFFWALMAFWLYRGIKEDKKRWWALAGLAGALGLMSKAVMLLAFPFLIFYLFQRKQLGKKWTKLLLFSGLMALGFIPVLVWNFQNDFMTFRHLSQLAGGGESSNSDFSFGQKLVQFFEYLGGQLAMISIFFIPLLFGSLKNVLKFRSQEKFYLILPAILTFGGFAVLSFGTEVIVNWPIFAYMGLPIVMASWVEEQSKSWHKIRNWGIVIGIGLPLILVLPDFTFLKSIEGVKKGEKAVFRRMSGYQPLADRLNHLQDSLQIQEPFYFSETYHMASELSFYLEGNPQTHMLNMGARRNQFDLWPGMEQFLGQERTGIFVSWNYDSPGEFASFQRLIYEEKFPVTFRGLPLRIATIQVYQNLTEFDPYVPETY